METETRQRIRVGRTEMDFSHQGRTLTAAHPFYGPANSLNLLSQIRGSSENPTGYREPTAPELASFVHEYFNGSELQASEVNQIMRDGYFRGFTGILYLPEEQVAHFIDHPEFDEKSYVDKNNLLKRLAESRAQVAFEHFREGSVEWRKVAKHPYFVAWAGGEEGAEKLAEITSKHSRKEAYIWAPDLSNLKVPEARVASLDSGRGLDDSRLSVDSGNRGDDGDSCAFGVLK